jgi:hypothetical protein
MPRIELSERLRDARSRTGTTAPEMTAPALPIFAQLTRKEARLRDDQLTALADLSRNLMRGRRVKEERITENTLIRVAIDLLLAHRHRLRGATEQELRLSVIPRAGNDSPVQATSQESS